VFAAGSVSGQTAAWIAAAGAAAGALIGATAGGIVEFVLARTGERREALVGARLVRDEIEPAASFLKQAEDEKKWWVFFSTPMDAWHAHRVALVARLTPQEREVVAQSVMELERTGREFEAMPIGFGAPFHTLSDDTVTSIKIMRTNATAAFNTLQRVAGGRRIDEGLLHDATRSPYPPQGAQKKRRLWPGR
jgi:hypothetical protein